MKQVIRQAWGAAGAAVWGDECQGGRPSDALDGGSVGWVGRECAERQRRVDWDGRVVEAWVAPLRLVVGGEGGDGGAVGSDAGEGGSAAVGGCSMNALCGTVLGREEACGRIGEMLELSGGGRRGDYVSQSGWPKGQLRCMRTALGLVGVVPSGAG